MLIRYAFAQFATKKDMPDAYLNIGIVAEADGRIGFQRIQRFDLLVRENPEYFAVYPEYIDAFKTEVDFFENALNAGQVSLDELHNYTGILRFSLIMKDFIESDDIDYFMDFTYENAVRADMRGEQPIAEVKKEESPSLINTPAFRYFVANHGCRQHQKREDDPLACEGCQIDYLDLVDKIVSHLPPEQYTTVREIALLKRAAEAFQTKKLP